MTQPEFSHRVWEMLRDGYGAEDIAAELDMDPKHVRAEVDILRQEGKLKRLSGNRRWGPTALRLMV